MTDKQYPELPESGNARKMTIAAFLRQPPNVKEPIYMAALDKAAIEQQRIIDADRAMRARESARLDAQQEAEPSTNTYVQQVPDKCDRIVWRGHYYHLPIKAAPSQDAARELFDAGWKAAARFCNREDVVADGIIGGSGCPQFEQAYEAARAQQEKK